MRLFILLMFFATFSFNATSIDKKQFYDVFKSESLDSVEVLLTRYEQMSQVEEVKIYQGALYIKKAGFLKKMGEKLVLFKIGREMVETKIAEQPENIEFRFIRLIIQEKVPAVLKYHSDKEKDAQLVINGVEQMERDVRDAIFDYSKNSASLTFD